MKDRVLNVRINVDNDLINLEDENEIMKYVKRSLAKEIAAHVEKVIEIEDLIETTYTYETETVSYTTRMAILPKLEYEHLKRIEEAFLQLKKFGEEYNKEQGFYND